MTIDSSIFQKDTTRVLCYWDSINFAKVLCPIKEVSQILIYHSLDCKDVLGQKEFRGDSWSLKSESTTLLLEATVVDWKRINRFLTRKHLISAQRNQLSQILVHYCSRYVWEFDRKYWRDIHSNFESTKLPLKGLSHLVSDTVYLDEL